MLERVRVQNVKVPTWPELSVAKLLPDVLSDLHLKHYSQDQYPKGKVPDRKYFWGVINAVKPGYYKSLVEGALQERSKIAHDDKEQERAINIKNDVLLKLLDSPSWMRK